MAVVWAESSSRQTDSTPTKQLPRCPVPSAQPVYTSTAFAAVGTRSLTLQDMTIADGRITGGGSGGAVYVEGDRVTKIIEKPPKGTSTTHWNNAGIYVFRKSIFEALDNVELSPRGEYELTDAVHAIVNSDEPVAWYAIEGFWRDIGRPEDIEHAEGFLEE